MLVVLGRETRTLAPRPRITRVMLSAEICVRKIQSKNPRGPILRDPFRRGSPSGGVAARLSRGVVVFGRSLASRYIESFDTKQQRLPVEWDRVPCAGLRSSVLAALVNDY